MEAQNKEILQNQQRILTEMEELRTSIQQMDERPEGPQGEEEGPPHYYAPETWLEKYWIALKAKEYSGLLPEPKDPEVNRLIDELLTANDLERFPTRESASNTIAIFPRGYLRPMRGLEVYAGPLVVISPSKLADPLNSKTAGGQARNALDGESSHYVGTEIDMGARFRMLLGGTELILGLEGGLFLPGDALKDKSGDKMAPIYGGRVLLGYRL